MLNCGKESFNKFLVCSSFYPNIAIACIESFKSTYNAVKTICTHNAGQENFSAGSNTDLIMMRVISRGN